MIHFECEVLEQNINKVAVRGNDGPLLDCAASGSMHLKQCEAWRLAQQPLVLLRLLKALAVHELITRRFARLFGKALWAFTGFIPSRLKNDWQLLSFAQATVVWVQTLTMKFWAKIILLKKKEKKKTWVMVLVNLEKSAFVFIQHLV